VNHSYEVIPEAKSAFRIYRAGFTEKERSILILNCSRTPAEVKKIESDEDLSSVGDALDMSV
jgi:hypothetical protein